MKRERNITRLDYYHRTDYGGWSHTLGWWVRLYRTDALGKKTCTSKVFSDGVHGGKRKALAKAIAWRDKAARRLPPPKKLQSAPSLRPGDGHVRRTMRWRRNDWWPVWEGWVRLEGRRCAMTNWSIERWGSAEAKRRCEAWLAGHRRRLRPRKVTRRKARGRAGRARRK